MTPKSMSPSLSPDCTSLANAGFEVNQDIIDTYTEYSPTRDIGGNVVSVSFTNWSLPEAPADRYTDQMIADAKSFSDTAMIVLARSGGETGPSGRHGRSHRRHI